jgi:hypothetical protein
VDRRWLASRIMKGLSFDNFPTTGGLVSPGHGVLTDLLIHGKPQFLCQQGESSADVSMTSNNRLGQPASSL